MEKKLALYARTSTDKQEKGLEAQQRALHEYLEYKKISEKLEFFDDGISGSMKKQRPGYDALWKAIRAGEVHTVLVYSFSRFARSTKELIDALDVFEKSEIAFISLSENIDTRTPGGRLVFTIFAGLAQFEREQIVERVKNGLKNARAKGKVLGRPKLREDEPIMDLLQKKLSVKKIAETLGVSRAAVYRAMKSAA